MVDMITKRKSCRSYTDAPLSEELIQKILALEMKPLYPQIGVEIRVVSREHISCICPFTTKQLIAVYAEKKDGYQENVGFMLQQMDLYLQKLGLGVCWLGLGKPDKVVKELVPGKEFVILLTVGYPEGDAQRKDLSDFKRKGLDEIADREDIRLENARLAPSACNSQPWYFVHEGEDIHIYWDQSGILKRAILEYFNPMDVGIALAHLYLTYPETFSFRRETGKECKNYKYMGTFHI